MPIGPYSVPRKHYAIQDEPPPANTEHIKRKFLNIPYANLSQSQKLDVYLPDTDEGLFPVILWLHGGAFMGCDKADEQVLPALKGLKRDYAVVSINYRLSGEAKFPAPVYDAKAAVRWIKANAQGYHLNPAKIAAWGASAGGYLAIMLGTSSGVETMEDLTMGNPDKPCNVQAVTAWFGPSDFLKMDEQLAEIGLQPPMGMEHNSANSPESLLFGQTITKIPEVVRAANPIAYFNQNMPPFFIQHGTRDATVPVQQSIVLAAKLKAILGDDMVTLELLEGAEHADPKFETPENVKKVLDFLDKHLKRT
jgi:acetyl esterase/lipase